MQSSPTSSSPVHWTVDWSLVNWSRPPEGGLGGEVYSSAAHRQWPIVPPNRFCTNKLHKFGVATDYRFFRVLEGKHCSPRKKSKIKIFPVSRVDFVVIRTKCVGQFLLPNEQCLAPKFRPTSDPATLQNYAPSAIGIGKSKLTVGPIDNKKPDLRSRGIDLLSEDQSAQGGTIE